MATVFEFFRFSFHFRAVDTVRFPAGKAGNAVRGALGLALRDAASSGGFACLFQPAAGPHAPSGLADPPRSFVIRAGHLDGVACVAGSSFFWDVHLFDLRHPPLDALRQAFQQLAQSGIGPGRGRAVLERVEQLDLGDNGREVTGAPDPPLAVDLDSATPAAGVRLGFLTPTELKGEGGLLDRPEFPVLFGRLRDRLGALSALYGRGPLAVDFRGLGERACGVRLVRCALDWQQVERRSGRTGQVHSIGGFTGEAEYAGDLGEFLPWLAAARWVGVGRQTVWGKGDVRVVLYWPDDGIDLSSVL